MKRRCFKFLLGIMVGMVICLCTEETSICSKAASPKAEAVDENIKPGEIVRFKEIKTDSILLSSSRKVVTVELTFAGSIKPNKYYNYDVTDNGVRYVGMIKLTSAYYSNGYTYATYSGEVSAK